MREVLIIDDNFKKREYLKNEILRLTNNYNIYECDTLLQAINHIILYKENIELIFLDWTFPYSIDTNPCYEQGLNVLKFLTEEKININTIIFSMDKIVLKKQDDNVKHIIKYNPYESIEEEVKDSLKIRRKVYETKKSTNNFIKK